MTKSGFKKNHSCINQLASQIHEIYSSLEVRGVLLDLSKAFDKVWHDSLIYNLNLLGISGSLLKLIQNYLDNRFQRVLLNGQTSEWKLVKAGVLQGSIHGPLFYLVYINYICSNPSPNVKLFADDTSLFSVVNDANESFKNLSNLCIISNGLTSGKGLLTRIYPNKLKKLFFQEKTSIQSHPVLTFDSSPVIKTTHHKHLGLILDEKLDFEEHFKEKMSKAVLRKLQNIIQKKFSITTYKSFIHRHLDDGDIIYHQPNNRSFCQKIESIQYIYIYIYIYIYMRKLAVIFYFVTIYHLLEVLVC